MPQKAKAIGYILTAAFFFALMTTFVKLAGDLPSMQKSFFRNFVAFFIALICLLRSKEKLLHDKRNIPGLIARSLFGTLGIFCNYYAIDRLLLSDANMLNKLSPFFAIIASYFLLNEKVSLRQACCIFLAFIGSLFIIKPTGGFDDSFAAFLGLIGGICAGIAYTFVRKVSKHGERGPFIVLFFSGFSCLSALPFLVFQYHPMTMAQLGSLLCAGLSAAIAQFAITAAYAHAPAKEISIFDYTQVIFSAIIGFFLFDQLPDRYSIIGYLIICSVSVFTFYKDNPQLFHKQKPIS